MPREECHQDETATCVAGLHFCSRDYLDVFRAGHGARILIVEVDPADVTGIPSDYNRTKGRTSRYLVVGDPGAQGRPNKITTPA